MGTGVNELQVNNEISTESLRCLRPHAGTLGTVVCQVQFNHSQPPSSDIAIA